MGERDVVAEMRPLSPLVLVHQASVTPMELDDWAAAVEAKDRHIDELISALMRIRDMMQDPDGPPTGYWRGNAARRTYQYITEVLTGGSRMPRVRALKAVLERAERLDGAYRAGDASDAALAWERLRDAMREARS